jgi:hypothetical protein
LSSSHHMACTAQYSIAQHRIPCQITADGVRCCAC